MSLILPTRRHLLTPRLQRMVVGNKNSWPDLTKISNGTNDSFNNRQKRYTAFPIRNPSVAYVGYGINGTGEVNFANAVTYRSAIELPDGTVAQFPTNAANGIDHVVNPGDIFNESNKIAGFTIPPGFFWVRNWGSVVAPQVFYGNLYFNNTAGQSPCEIGVGLADKSLSGTVAAQAVYGAHPPFILGDVPASARAVLLTGDSRFSGAGSYTNPTYGGMSYAAGALDQYYAYSHLSYTGWSTGTFNGEMTKRYLTLAHTPFTDAWVELGINDMNGGNQSAAYVIGKLATAGTGVYDLLQAALPRRVRIYQQTIEPAIITSPLNTAPTSSLSDGRLGTFNAAVRALLAGTVGSIDVAAMVSNDTLYSDSSYIGTDGLHMNSTGQAVAQAGIIAARPFGGAV